MTRILTRSARALPLLALAASSALVRAQIVPAPTAQAAPALTQPSATQAAPIAPASAPSAIFPPASAPATAPASALEPATAPTTAPSAADPALAPSTQPISVLVPAATQSSGWNPATRPAQKISLEFKDASVDSVLDYLSAAAGFIVVKEAPIDGRVTVVSRGPVTPQEALTLLNAVLKPSGFTAIEQGRVLKIVRRETAKKQNIPVEFGADPELIPETDELITQVIPVKNVDATKLRQDLQPLISADADFAANQGSNSLILTDSTANIRRIVKIVEKLDQHEATASDIRIVQLTYANAASAAKLITSVFAPEQTNAAGGAGAGGGGPGGMFRRMMMMGGGRGGGGGGGGAGGAGGEGDGKAAGKVTAAADDRTNTIVVTAPTDTLKLIDQILKVLDSDPAAVSEVKIFVLKYADSASAAKLIDTVFSDAAPGTPQSAANSASSHIPALEGLSQTMRGGHVSAANDDRTNTLVVTAPSEAMRIITSIVTQLDANPAAESAFFIYKLRNGVATDIQTTLNSLFGGNANGSSASGGTANRTAGQSLTSSGLGSNSGFGSSGSSRGGSSGGAFGGSGSSGGFGAPLTSTSSGSTGNRNGTSTGSSSMSGPNRQTSEMAGMVYVVADPDTNSLLVTTANRYAEQVKKIIEELDRPVAQVLIKCLVAEVTHETTNDLGVDFSILDTRPSGKGTTVAQQMGNAAAATANGGLIVTMMEDNLNATLHALATEGKLDVLSRPYILASDNQLASITVGQEVPFITNTQINITGQQVNTISYQAVGIILNVTPHISPDGLVVLDVAPEISQLTGTTVPIGAGVSAPVIANRSAQSRVAIRSGNTIVIGGMMQDQKTTTISKIPFLGDIPIIGAAFTRYQDDRTKTELLIFMTPHVALAPDSLPAMSKDELKGTKLTPNAVEPGNFQEHIRGMDRGANSLEGATTRPAAVMIAPTPSTQPVVGITVTTPTPPVAPPQNPFNPNR